MIGLRLYLAQRISAIVMAPLILGHIALMIYAVRNGLTAGEILGRTQGSIWWGTYYSLFVLAVSVHAAIGVRAIVHETLGLARRPLDVLTTVIATGLAIMGFRAIAAVVLT